MSQRPGTPNDTTFSAVALGAAAGQNYAVNSPSGSAILSTVAVVYVASATVGNRIPVLRVLNPEGLILWSAVFGTAVTAGQTTRLLAGAGTPAVVNSTPLQQTFPLPVELGLETGCTIQVLDAANIDTADTVQVNMLVSY